MKITLEISEQLWRRVKAMAGKRRQSLDQIVSAALERQLTATATFGNLSKPRQASIDASLRELESLSQRISAAWPQGVTPVEAIREQRRDL